MLAKLRSHEYAALVLDKPAIQAIAAQAPDCDLYPVGEFVKLDITQFTSKQQTA